MLSDDKEFKEEVRKCTEDFLELDVNWWTSGDYQTLKRTVHIVKVRHGESTPMKDTFKKYQYPEHALSEILWRDVAERATVEANILGNFSECYAYVFISS